MLRCTRACAARIAGEGRHKTSGLRAAPHPAERSPSWQADSIRKAIDAHVKRFSMSKKNPLKSIRNDL